MSEEKKFDEKEVKKNALELLKRFLSKEKESKKYKFIYKQLKNLTVENIEILPSIHPTVSKLLYEVTIFRKYKYDKEEEMEGKWKITSPNFCISEDGLDDISLRIIKECNSYTYSNCMSYMLEEHLCKHSINLYKRDNEVSLYNLPSDLRATISTFSPIDEVESSWGYHPIAAKIKNKDGKELYFVINVYNDESNGLGLVANPFSLLNFSNMIIFDSDKKTYKVKQGLFGYKLI